MTKSLLFALVLCIGVLPFIPAGAQSEVLGTVLFTCDTRGFTDGLTYIERYKENTENALLINCGNFTKGSAEASYSNAKYSSQLMKEAEYDIISLGTDDFSYGFRALKRFSDYTGCQLLSGNLTYSSADVFEKSIIKQVGSVKLGLFSLIDSATKDYIPTARADGYAFEDEIDFAKEQIEYLKTRCDKIICLASFCENHETFTPELLTKQLEGLDVLICSNTAKELNEEQNGVLVLSAAEKLASLGEISILNDGSMSVRLMPAYYYDEKGEQTEQKEGTYHAFGQSLVYNTAAKKVLEEFETTINDSIAMNKTTIYGVHEQQPVSLVEETPLGDLFADAMTIAGEKIQAADTTFKNHIVTACINGTAIKNNIPSGDITLRNVFDAAEIAEDVYFYETDVKTLFNMMERSVSELQYDEENAFVHHPSEKFLQISGFHMIVDPTKTVGERIIRMYRMQGDDEIDMHKKDDTKVLLALNESLAKGAEGYDLFSQIKPVYVGDFLVNYLRTAIASAVSENYYISPGTESRISFKRIEQLQPNGDAWAVIGTKYEEHAACEVLVDGIDNMDCSQVDENGEVKITLKTGAHGITVNGEDTYVSTETGLGIKKNTIVPIVDYKLYYKTLDDAYKIDEDAYKKAAVDGYFEYLSRAYVETKLTEEGEVVKATQDIFNVWDDFLENPDSFIKKDEEEAEEEEDDSPYPQLEDFAYHGTFYSSVFENTPKTIDSDKKTTSPKTTSNQDNTTQVTAVNAMQSAENENNNTGDSLSAVLYLTATCFVVAGCSILSYLLIKEKKGSESN